LVIKPKPNRTGRFFQKFNRFNRFFFRFGFFGYFFSGFFGLIGFLVFLLTLAPCYGQSLIKICLGHRAPVNFELCRVSMLSTLLHCFAYSYVPSRGLSEAWTSTLSTSFTHLEYIYIYMSGQLVILTLMFFFFKKQRRWWMIYWHKIRWLESESLKSCVMAILC
jgi:hypothetical protein